MPNYKLTYFDFDGGRGEPIRIAFHAAGIDFEDYRLSFPEFGEMRRNIRFNAVPVLEIDGAEVTQSNGLSRYIGKLAGLYPEDDLQALVSLVLTQNPGVDLGLLGEFYPETAGHLDIIIRSIIGLDPEAVKARFTGFVQQHPSLTAKQIRFIGLLQNHIAKNGGVEIDRLYEAPFTSIDSDGLDGVFPDEVQVIELLDIIYSFDPTAPQEAQQQ